MYIYIYPVLPWSTTYYTHRHHPNCTPFAAKRCCQALAETLGTNSELAWWMQALEATGDAWHGIWRFPWPWGYPNS